MMFKGTSKVPMNDVRICIVEDDSLLLDNLSLLLRGEAGFVVAGAFSDAETALGSMSWRDVDVLLSDIDLPGMSGVELIRALKERHPSLNCMAYTIYEDRSTVFAAIKAGACGFLIKGASPRELIESLRELHEGGSPMSPRIARKVLLDIQDDGRPAGGGAPPILSDREIQILRQLERGLSYKGIAVELHISPHTVHTHIKNIYEKVHANGRADVLRKARNLGAL